MIKELKKEAQNLSVLFVEDDPSFLNILKELLEKFFPTVETAMDGEEGLAKYKEAGSFDIVITDITMPKMDGLTMSENIKSINPSQHILAVSAHSDADKLIKAIDIGVDSFLLKPVDSVVFLDRLLKISKAVNRKALEDREKELENLLITQSKMASMGEMISIISHQLKQPLNAVNILSSNIEDRVGELCGTPVDEEVAKNIRLISEQVSFMAMTIDTFSEFMKPSKMATTFSLRRSVDDVLSILSARLKSKRVEVEVDIDESIKVFGYPKEFNQAILNIISNASDALPEKEGARTIEVAASCEGSRVLLTIEDNAGGICSEIINRVFEPYITSKGDSGTGLGLHITRKIIEEHFDGSVKVENTDKGAKFHIELKSSN
ncbi:MAG TPA: response regulator [Campylobacterales bacterium]|nr:response regulator [Campylobacterales bacterium]